MSEPIARYARNRRIFLVLLLFSGLAVLALGGLSALVLWPSGSSDSAAGSAQLTLACASVSGLASLATFAGFLVAAVRLSRARTQARNRAAKEFERLAKWREVLENRFNISELRTLCSDLRVDYDDLSGETRLDKTHALLFHLSQAQRLAELAQVGARLRPDIPWDRLTGD